MHLFYKENIWSNPHASSIHPVIQYTYNNSMNRIISKEEEREDIQREILQSSLSSVSTYNSTYKIPTQIQEYPVILPTRTPSVSTRNPANSTYRINSIQNLPRNTTTTRLIPCKASSSDCSHASKHSTWQNKAPGPYSTSRLPVNSTRQNLHSRQQQGSLGSPCSFPVLPVNSTQQKQLSKRQPASTQPLQ